MVLLHLEAEADVGGAVRLNQSYTIVRLARLTAFATLVRVTLVLLIAAELPTCESKRFPGFQRAHVAWTRGCTSDLQFDFTLTPVDVAPIELQGAGVGETDFSKLSVIRECLRIRTRDGGRRAWAHGGLRTFRRARDEVGMNEVCTDRIHYSLDEAVRYITSVSGTLRRGHVSYVVAGPCTACRSWHVRLVARPLKLAS